MEDNADISSFTMEEKMVKKTVAVLQEYDAFYFCKLGQDTEKS